MREIGNRLKKIICGFLVLLLFIPTVTGFEIGDRMDDDVEIEQLEETVSENSGEDKSITAFPLENMMEIPQDPILVELLKNSKRVELTREEQALFKRENPNLDLYHPRTLDNKPLHWIPVQASEPEPATTSGSRSTRAGEDLELWNLKWTEINSAWCEQTDPEPSDYPTEPANWFEGNQAQIGSFMVDQTTTITVTVRNNGNTAVSNVPVNLSITDYIHGGQPMARNPTNLEIPLIGPGQTAEVSYDWKVPYASTSFRISATVDWPDDPDTTNNYLGWNSRMVMKWEDDLEGSTAGWSHYPRIDITATSIDDWHITTTAFAQSDPTHTIDNSWHEGHNDGPGATYPIDGYRNDNALSLESPIVNLGNNVDTRFWYIYLGDVEGGQYDGYEEFEFHLTAYNWLITGETEEGDNLDESDVLYAGEVSDDAGLTWGGRYNMAFSGRLGNPGETEWYNYYFYSVNSNAQEIYYYDGIPFNYNISDWTKVRFRQTFDSDDDNVQNIGYYLDDYIIFGNDNFTVPYRVGVTEFTIPEVLSIPIVHSKEGTTFSSKVKNYGGAMGTVNAVLKIKDMNTGEEWQESTKSVTLGVDEEKTQQWSWTPDKDGDFLLTIVAGDPSLDWTPFDNERSRKVHVRTPTENEVLVVDDDNGMLNGGSYYMEVEDKMLRALEAVQVEFDVYTVDANATGPQLNIMEDYITVIWLTGLDYQSDDNDDWAMALKPEDEAQLEMFLDLDDHNLWLISPGHIIENFGTNPGITGSDDFARQYLKVWEVQGKVSEVEDRGTPDPIDGVIDTLTEDADGTVSYATYEEDPPKYFSDIGCVAAPITTEESAEGIFYQNDAHTTFNAVSYAGDSTAQYKTVFLGFNFYLLSVEEERIDLVEKVLTFFGMMGGVQVECLDDTVKWVKPSEEVHFHLKVTNLGKKTDTMKLRTKISSQTLANENDWPTSRFEIGGVVEYEVDVLGTQSSKNYNDDIYLIVTAPGWDLAAAEWKTEYMFEITADSGNTGMTNSTTVKVIIDLYSNITVSYSKVYQEIDVDDSWECSVTINNNTNGDQTFDVELTIEGEAKDLASFVENDQDHIRVMLTPNFDRRVKLKIQSGEHEFAGFHNITVEVKGATTNILYDKSTIATEIEQFYDVAINRSNIIPVVIDPNDEAGEKFVESFNFQVQNFGNGYDSVNFKIESHPKYTVFEEWMTALKIIFDDFELKTVFDDSELNLKTTETLLVHPYDESKVPAYGEAEITVTVDIPTNISHGEYWFNLIAESEAGLDSEENDENNNATIMLKIIKPDLIFSPTDLDDRTYDNYRYRTIENYQFIDDDLEASIPWDEDDEEFIVNLDHNIEGGYITLRVEIVINNIGDSPAALEALIQTIMIIVTHEEEIDGELVTIEDIILYPVSASTTIIQPGENATIIFETWRINWEDPDNDIEYVYTFNVIIDQEDYILEKNEGNNEDSFELIVYYMKKPEPRPPTPASTELIALIIIIIIVAAILVIFFFVKRKRPPEVDEEDEEEVNPVDNPRSKP